jgi:hypothetical protein
VISKYIGPELRNSFTVVPLPKIFNAPPHIDSSDERRKKYLLIVDFVYKYQDKENCLRFLKEIVNLSKSLGNMEYISEVLQKVGVVVIDSGYIEYGINILNESVDFGRRIENLKLRRKVLGSISESIINSKDINIGKSLYIEIFEKEYNENKLVIKNNILDYITISTHKLNDLKIGRTYYLDFIDIAYKSKNYEYLMSYKYLIFIMFFILIKLSIIINFSLITILYSSNIKLYLIFNYRK